MKLSLLAGLALLVSSIASFAGTENVNWSKLIDPETQSFEDPYADLTYHQIDKLRSVLNLRSRIADDDLGAEARTSAEAALAAAETGLSKSGIDVDWLLAQRWVVAERRQAAATSTNPAFDGQIVTLAGFAIPAPPDADGTPVAYFVPERGMCSHMPPPNPNQMVRVRLSGDWTPTVMHEPVRLTGRLENAPSAYMIHVVDGPVSMAASFAMTATAVETFRSAGAAAAPGEKTGLQGILREIPPRDGSEMGSKTINSQ